MLGSYELAKGKIVENRQRDLSLVAVLDGDLTTSHHTPS
jgi:hypothetical protein